MEESSLGGGGGAAGEWLQVSPLQMYAFGRMMTSRSMALTTTGVQRGQPVLGDFFRHPVGTMGHTLDHKSHKYIFVLK